MTFEHYTHDLGMTAEQLYKAANAGERIEAPQVGAQVPASLQRVKHPTTHCDVFALWGITGAHFLNVACTDAARLHAHWQGFKETATSIARKGHA